jgi:AP-3 complex subunit mu
MPPIVSTSKYYLISIYRNDTFLLATTTGETQPLLIIEFLHRVFEIFEEYFGSVDEVTIKVGRLTVTARSPHVTDCGVVCRTIFQPYISCWRR